MPSSIIGLTEACASNAWFSDPGSLAYQKSNTVSVFKTLFISALHAIT